MNPLAWTACTLLLLAACVDRTGGQRYSKVVDSWVGRTEQELRNEWGNPSEVTDSAQESTILVYKTRFHINATNSWHYCTTKFQVDKDGVITAAKVERQGSELACRSGSQI